MPRTLGVRAKVTVGEPSRTQIEATMHYRMRGSARTAELGTVSQHNPGQRRVRLALPDSLQDRLSVRRRVRLELSVKARPDSQPDCIDPRSKRVEVQTRVVRLRRPVSP